MCYTLKEKIKVTEEFLTELIAKSWQETEALQQQIANIDTATQLGAEVAKLLKNTCTNYYVLIGRLESLAENPNSDNVGVEDRLEPVTVAQHDGGGDEAAVPADGERHLDAFSEAPGRNSDFEPFEYFVDFDEPSGDPLTDKDLYNN